VTSENGIWTETATCVTYHVIDPGFKTPGYGYRAAVIRKSPNNSILRASIFSNKSVAMV
jgi:hypothetical protein